MALHRANYLDSSSSNNLFVFDSNENFKICFRDLLTFIKTDENKTLISKSFFQLNSFSCLLLKYTYLLKLLQQLIIRNTPTTENMRQIRTVFLAVLHLQLFWRFSLGYKLGVGLMSMTSGLYIKSPLIFTHTIHTVRNK